MKLKNIALIVFAGCTAGLLASNFQVRSDYSALKEEALEFRQDCAFFSMDVMAVDAVTGEAVPRAVVDHRAEYPLDSLEQVSFPRLSRVYSPEQGCTKVSGLSDHSLSMVMTAPNYEETAFEIVPNRSEPNQPVLIVKMKRLPEKPLVAGSPQR